MKITINGTDYAEHFGIGFVRAMDEKYFIASDAGLKFGCSMETQIPKLLDGDPVVLSEFLYEGTCTEEKRPTQKEVDRFVDEAGNIEDLFNEVVSELKKGNATRAKVAQIEESLRAEQEALDEMERKKEKKK